MQDFKSNNIYILRTEWRFRNAGIISIAQLQANIEWAKQAIETHNKEHKDNATADMFLQDEFTIAKKYPL